MIKQIIKQITSNKLFPFFVLSVFLHLFILLVFVCDTKDKDKFIQIPIDVDFMSPVATDNAINTATEQKQTKQEKVKEMKNNKSDIEIAKNKKNKKKEDKKEKKKKEEQKEQKKVEKKENIKQVDTSVKRNNTINPFNTSDNSGAKGVFFENSNFKFSYYTNSIIKKIRRNWHWSNAYTSLRAIVYFKINRDGDVIVTKIKESSGNEDFDNNALRAVQLSSPFAPLPESYSENDLGVYFEFKFN